MFRRTFSAIAVASALASIAGAASAASTSTTLQVSATVLSACTVSTTPLAFGSFSILTSGPVDAFALLSVNCTTGTVWTAALDVGAGPGATFQSRKLVGPAGATLNYSLATSSSNFSPLLPWGDGSSGSETQFGSGNGADQSLPIFGRIFGPQTISATGTYNDTVTVTVSF